MGQEFYMLTDRGRKMGDVIVALYRANKFLSVQELVDLSGQDNGTVNDALKLLQELGEVSFLADEMKYGLMPEARWVMRDIEIRMGKDVF